MRLLTAGDQRLLEEAADRFATVKTEVALPRAEAEQPVGPGRSQPLERDRQRVVVELLANAALVDAAVASALAAPARPRTECLRRSVVRSQPSALHVIG